MSLHLDTLSWFGANQSLFILLNAAMLIGEARNTNFIDFGLTQQDLKPTIYHIQGKHANHYTTHVVLNIQQTPQDLIKQNWP